jgi:S-adenosylmethionine-diacylglycerol 3-amino-3-carboxypropyl transferase
MLLNRIRRACFNLIHGRNLVYNACWEDPRLDRVALNLGPQDNVLVITSAGCNALDYALAGAGHVYTVDMNRRQNALLELKLAGAKGLDYETYFTIFGTGSHPNFEGVYREALRRHLSPGAQKYWDKKGKFFSPKGRRKSFYFRGSSGFFAYLANVYIKRVAKLRKAIDELLDAKTLEQQREIYDRYQMRNKLWKPMVNWMLRRDVTLALLGVPRSQREQIDRGYPGGIVKFIVDRVETVFTKIPIQDNYFWRVYLTGDYTPDCCPEYLKPANFERMKTDVVNRVTSETNSLLGFLEKHDQPISRFVLLDHMDWLYSNAPEILGGEWQAIVDRATPGARIIWRSAGLSVDFVDPLIVQRNGRKVSMGDLLHYHRDLAAELHARDRVHTYGSFYIAELKNADS